MEVTLYHSPTCPYCKMAKDMLDKSGIKYKSVDVSASKKVAEGMIEKSGQMGVPVIFFGEEKVIGFDASSIEAGIKLAKKESK